MEYQKLSIKGFALSGGVLWALGVLIVALINLQDPGYGEDFLEMVSSIYPGYEVDETPGSVVIGTLFAFIDGAIGGAVLAFLYNKFSAGDKAN